MSEMLIPGAIGGIASGIMACNAATKDTCVIRYPTESSEVCSGDMPAQCLGLDSNEGLILPASDDDDDWPGTKNPNSDPTNMLYNVRGKPGKWISNPNYIAQCYSKENNTKFCHPPNTKNECGVNCSFQPGHTGADGIPVEPMCVPNYTHTLRFKYKTNGSTTSTTIDEIAPRWEATDPCWYEENPTVDVCTYGKANTDGLKPIGAADDATIRVANSDLCKNKAVCINDSMLPDPYKGGKSAESTMSFYTAPGGKCDSGKERGGCDQGWTCRPGLIGMPSGGETVSYVADAPQPWMKYIQRPTCQFVKGKPLDGGDMLNGLGASIAGMFGINIPSPEDSAKDALKAAQDSINTITATNAAGLGEQTQNELNAFRQSIQAEQKALQIQASNLTEMLSWKVEKNTLYFNLVAIMVCIIILFELL